MPRLYKINCAFYIQLDGEDPEDVASEFSLGFSNVVGAAENFPMAEIVGGDVQSIEKAPDHEAEQYEEI